MLLMNITIQFHNILEQEIIIIKTSVKPVIITSVGSK